MGFCEIASMVGVDLSFQLRVFELSLPLDAPENCGLPCAAAIPSHILSEKHGKNGTAGSRTRTAFLASLECYRYTTVPLLKTQAYAVGYPPLQEEALLRGANRGNVQLSTASVSHP